MWATLDELVDKMGTAFLKEEEINRLEYLFNYRECLRLTGCEWVRWKESTVLVYDNRVS